MFGLKLIKISGASMAPLFLSGDFALIKKLRPSTNLAVGDVVLVRHPTYGLIVKALHSRADNAGIEAWQLIGTGGATTAMADLGAVPRSAIIGRAIWRLSLQGISRVRGAHGDNERG